MNDALTISGLTKTYKDFKLNGVSFSVPCGSIVGLIGENGAGKSTTINAILGLIQKEAGSICILGKEQLDSEIKEQIGVVFDGNNYPEILSPQKLNRVMKEIYHSWDEHTFLNLLRKFSLPADKQIKQFSKGMKMKLAIAVALSHNSKLLILDEATSGLDPVVRDEIIDMLLEFIQDEQHAALLSSHITSDLEKVCDYVTFIHRGKVLYSEEKDALLERMCILKCTQEQLKEIDRRAIHGVRRGAFGVEALAERDRLPDGCVTDRATLDDIIVYVAKGERK